MTMKKVHYLSSLGPIRKMMGPVRLMVLGAGNRGTIYSSFALEEPSRAQVVALVDPNIVRLKKLARLHGVDENAQWTEFPNENDEIWKKTASTGSRIIIDAVIVAVPDALHCQIVLRLIKLGQKYILLEKPMATSLADCRAIHQAAEESGAVVAVCHVLRYTPLNREVKRLIDSGELGTILSIQHTEPVGYYHYAHSYVRGNWRREDKSSFSLLTKSCHDIDLIAFWMKDQAGGDVRSVSSFGSRRLFRKENKPVEAGTASRCMACPFEGQCPYSAKKIYLERVRQGVQGWPVNVIVQDEVSEQAVESALKLGPYGRCVYECDNDVCDNQIVNLQFKNGSTASFTMIATTERICTRQTKIYGSKAELTADASSGCGEICLYDFLTNKRRVIHPKSNTTTATKVSSSLKGHGYADYFLMDSFIRAVQEQNPSFISTDAAESLKTHEIVFMAEQSRINATTLSSW